MKRRKEPVKPYAFVRVMNEIETIDTCLKSILPAIDRGVIAFNDCNDGTEEYVIEFCKLHTGFIPYKYTYDVYDLRDPRSGEKGNDEHKFHTYCNGALKLIPQNEWILKIDVDQTYEADMLKDMFYLPKDENDTIIFGILNLHYDGKELYFYKHCPYLINPDHWLIFNNNLESSLNILSKKPFSSEEHFDISGNHLVFTETNSYHFPFIKKRRNNISYDNLVEFDEFLKNDSLEKFIKGKGLPFYINPKVLDKNHVLSFCKDFNMNSKRILPKNIVKK
ncbi:MAG: hypothetical protein PHY80_03190 [Rickettsiales bacterium]|nr:hypothetical protein [Rickettsiales bacterium]